MYKILAVDDDEKFLAIIVGLLRYKNYSVDTLSNPTLALEKVNQLDYDCILLDVKMPGIDGISLLEEISNLKPTIPIIMISGQSTLSIAVNAIKKGAYDFLEKGSDSDRLLITVQNAIEKKNWHREKQVLLSEILEQFQMVGESRIIKNIFEQIKTVAPTEAKVLICGETGTGKELVARAVHLNSLRATKPYIKVNCAAIPETLIESRFFGHKKGSFSGAFTDQAGKFELADNGTIFLDEIGELNLQAQAKLLRVLQDGEIEKIGDTKPSKVNVRIIAATNKNLKKRVADGYFREDLYHRLRVIELTIPPLHERLQDIPLLVQHFLNRFSEQYNKTISEISHGALNILMQQKWPGNVRMLENVIEKACIFAKNPTIQAQQIIAALKSNYEAEVSDRNVYLKDYIEQVEKEYISQKLLITEGKKQEAADMLGIDRATLWKKIKRYSI